MFKLNINLVFSNVCHCMSAEKAGSISRHYFNSRAIVVAILGPILQFNKRLFLVTRLSLLILVISIPTRVGLFLNVVNALSFVHGVLHAKAGEHCVVGCGVNSAGRQLVITDKLWKFLGNL